MRAYAAMPRPYETDLNTLSESLIPRSWMARIGGVISLPALTVCTRPGRIRAAHIATYQTGA